MPKNVFHKTPGYAILFALMLSTLMMTGCDGRGAIRFPPQGPSPSPTPESVPFETIGLVKTTGGKYDGRQPYLALIASVDDIEKVRGLVRADDLTQLRELDFQRYFAVAIFRGWQGSGGYATIIERMVRCGDQYVVYVQFWEPGPHYVVIEAITHPYHLVKVHRGAHVGQEIELVLHTRMLTPMPPF